MNTYKCLTIEDLINYITINKKKFPNGLKTHIMSGDFEYNYTHENHEIQYLSTTKYGNCICLSYEMHENYVGV